MKKNTLRFAVIILAITAGFAAKAGFERLRTNVVYYKDSSNQCSPTLTSTDANAFNPTTGTLASIPIASGGSAPLYTDANCQTQARFQLP